MNEDIKVHVVKYPDRVNLMMRYLDPATGKQVPPHDWHYQEA